MNGELVKTQTHFIVAFQDFTHATPLLNETFIFDFIDLHESSNWRAVSPNKHHRSLSHMTFTRNLQTTVQSVKRSTYQTVNDFYSYVTFRLWNSMLALTGELRLQKRIAIAFSYDILCILQANVFGVRQAWVEALALNWSKGF